MEEKKKHKVMIGIEVVLLCMLVAILGTNAASSNPPSNGVSYGGNNQTTVEGALNDLYNKANYGNASEGQIMSGKTALVGGKKVTGTIVDRTNDTGTLGLAWSTGNYEMIGNQLRIGVNKGYYGTNNYSNWGTSGIVFNDYQKKLGITADKIVKGQSIAGINGTGETSCPTCPTPESQGYWKVYNFDLPVTEIFDGDLKPVTFKNGTWKKLFDKCDTASGAYKNSVTFCSAIDMNFDSKEILMKYVSLTGNMPISKDNFRMSRGYASGTTTAQYLYMYSLNNFMKFTTSQVSSDSCLIHPDVYFSNSKICFDVGAPVSTMADQFTLSGKIIYK